MTENIRDIQIGTVVETTLSATRILGAACSELLSLDPRTLPAPEKLGDASNHQSLLFLSDDCSRGRLADALAKYALAAGHKVTILTQLHRQLPEGAEELFGARQDEAFLQAIFPKFRKEDGAPRFTSVVDCGGRNLQDARQDLDFFSQCASHILFLSNDLVYDPLRRGFPTTQNNAAFCTAPDSPWTQLRQAETEFLQAPTAGTAWTILRSTMLLIDEESLDDLPPFTRRLEAIRQEQDILLPAGGHWLIQPLFVEDLAKIILALPASPESQRAIIDCAGPLRMEIRQFFELTAQMLHKRFLPCDLPEAGMLEHHPEYAPFFCHRLYPLTWNFPNLPKPATFPAEALKKILLS